MIFFFFEKLSVSLFDQNNNNNNNKEINLLGWNSAECWSRVGVALAGHRLTNFTFHIFWPLSFVFISFDYLFLFVSLWVKCCIVLPVKKSVSKKKKMKKRWMKKGDVETQMATMVGGGRWMTRVPSTPFKAVFVCDFA